jgi:hypothetical protein
MSKERTIISHFSSSTKAQAAIDALASVSLTDATLKRASRFGVTNDFEINDPISNAQTLTGLTLFSGDTSNGTDASARILMGADPSVSGMSAEGHGMMSGHAFTVVAFVPEERTEEAVSILKQNDGMV